MFEMYDYCFCNHFDCKRHDCKRHQINMPQDDYGMTKTVFPVDNGYDNCEYFEPKNTL